MARKSSLRREFSIPGDELEQHRIQLEHNLQHTDLSLHLSSLPDDEAGDDESLEYPRHDSVPEHFPAFASFDPHSGENLDLDASRIHAWSIHDDEGIAPYDARTMSTPAHHANAVTITAGLNRGGRREPSLSGAEYDPERPLQNIIAACHVASEVDDPERSQSISRPKLSQTLQRVGFSPRRPRSGPSRVPQGSNGMPESSQNTRRNTTPRARKATVSFDTTSGSRFTKMARGLVRDVRQAQAEDITPALAAGYRSVGREGLTRNTADAAGDLDHESRLAKKSHHSRVHLPDVTGLTNVIVSPAKANLERYGVRSPSSKEVEARLIASLNALHTRLNHLETENSIARRRVRELEYELEECKRDVVRERTRIMESQDSIDVSAARIPIPSTSRGKGKERRHKDTDVHASKYLEVVQEKKALEALVNTLRSHLTRVTSDLSCQQQLLEDLRSLRESDALSLAEKAQEINQLRAEMERLAGEIEVLRGVVEEGLNERRQGRNPDPSFQGTRLADAPSVRSHRPLSPVVESPDPSVRRFVDDEEIDRISVDLDERRSERASNSSAHSSYSISSRPRVQDANEKADEGVESNPPFPKIGSERMERLFFSTVRHNATSCRMCKGHHHSNRAHCDKRKSPTVCEDDEDKGFDNGIEQHAQSNPREIGCNNRRTYSIEEILERMDRNGGTLRPGDVPPQTVLARVIGELEDEFAHFREIYSKLADEYRSLDSASEVASRQGVGDRLRDVINVLECKGNQIASLYDLLIFEDRPLKQ